MSNRSTDSVAKLILAADGQKAWANAQLLPRNLCSEPEGTMLEVVVNEAGDGVDPAPDRKRHSTWKSFLQAYWDVLASVDFTTIDCKEGETLASHARRLSQLGHSGRVTPNGISANRSKTGLFRQFAQFGVRVFSSKGAPA